MISLIHPAQCRQDHCSKQSLCLAALAAGMGGWCEALSPPWGTEEGKGTWDLHPHAVWGRRGGTASIRLYCLPKHRHPPQEQGELTREEDGNRCLQAEVWQAGSEGDHKVTHPTHTFFFEIWRGVGGRELCQLLP